MRRRRATSSRVRLWVGGAAVLAATATAGVAAVGMTGSASTDDASAAIRTAETLAPQATDAPTLVSESPQPVSASPSPTAARPRQQLPGGAPRAATGSSPSPKASSAAPAPRRADKAPAASTGSPELAVLAQINEARAEAGAGPLTMNTQLVAAAHAHNLRMADGCGLSHQCGGESGIGDRISAQGVQWSSVAENVGTGGPVDDSESAQTEMATGLTDSMLAEVPPDDGHRKNILNPGLSRIGIDVIRDDNGTVWLTHDFAN